LPTLAIRSVTKIYPNMLRALDGLTLDVGDGVFGLLGPNGAGKSTLMSILAAELEFEAGTVSLDGVDVRRDPLGWRARLGFMPQTLDFVAHITGREYMRQCALLSGYSPRGLRDRIAMLLDRVHLTEAADRWASSYSRGMKQRLAAAAAFLCEPDLVLLDEPTSGLDPKERVFFRELLAEFGGGRIAILSTHIVADVERCCDRIAVVEKGTLKFAGAPSELLRRAEGRVWETRLASDEAGREAERRRLVSLGTRDGAPLARVIADAPPNAEARGVAPNLEDAYMCLVSTGPMAEESSL